MASTMVRSLVRSVTKQQPLRVTRAFAPATSSSNGNARSNYTFAPLTQLSEDEIMFKDTGGCITYLMVSES